MTKLLLSIAIINMFFSAPALAAVNIPPDPSAPMAPVYTPEETEQMRERQQGEAERSYNATAPMETAPSRTAIQETGNPADMQRTMQAIEQFRKAKVKDAEAAQADKRKSTGITLMTLSLAGMIGLGLGRFAINAISKTSVKEAERTMKEQEAVDDNSQSFGGDHRQYFID